MFNELNLSVVINTYNRADSLSITLESLYYQTTDNFEVIVVNGPSTDNTLDVVKKYNKKIKLVNCTERNLSVSRNMGIEAASGDIVAFIDDDAIADPNWVKDLIEAYDDLDIGGVGGLVYDHTGMKLQYRYSACDRKGDTDFGIQPPFNEFCIPYCEKFLYLQGTNCSFRKSYLIQVGGFDEEFEYYLDEVDVCMRIIDAGYKIKPLDRAIVHHKYMKSFLRNEAKVVLHPYSTVKNKHYFAIKNSNKNNKEHYINSLNIWVAEVRAGGNWNYLNKKITKEELNTYLQEVDDACRDGLIRGDGTPKTRKLTTMASKDFLPFSTVQREEKILKICYLSKEYPPINFGGIGRYTYDLATTFAAKGHEVHVITEGTNQDTVDFENGVWVHRLVSRMYEPYENMTMGWNFSLLTRNYFELERINALGPIDIVNGPIWLCETGMANCSGNYPTILTLMTTQKILNELTKMPSKDDHAYKLMKLEEIDISQHAYIHAISNSILANCKESMDENAMSFIVPLGCRDLSSYYKDHKKKNKIVIYSVGRLEHRKGTDLLLRAAEQILNESKYSNVEFIIAGKETTNTQSGISYREEFQKRNSGKTRIINNVKFLGEITEQELMQNYCDADIACTPSRYESFGIVLLEGMSFTNAIVAANVGGMKDIVINEDTGLFFQSDDVDDLVRQIKKLLDDKQYRKEMAKRARQKYEEMYSLEAVYSNLYKQYIKITQVFKKKSSFFDLERFAQMISAVEQISIESARKTVELILEKKETLVTPMVLFNENNSSLKIRLIRKVYHSFRKCCPSLAIKIKNMWVRKKYGKEKKNLQFKCRSLALNGGKLIFKIPFLGWLIKYMVNIILLPVRMNRMVHSFEALLNNDELLKQVGKIVCEQTNKTRDVVWKVEKEVSELIEKQPSIMEHLHQNSLTLQQLNHDKIAFNEVLKNIEWNQKDILNSLINSNDLIQQYKEKMASKEMQTEIINLMKQKLEENQNALDKKIELNMRLIKQEMSMLQQLVEEKSKVSGFIESILNDSSERNCSLDEVLNLLSDLTTHIHYDIEDYSNRSVDKLNQRLTDVRSEILFELIREKKLEQLNYQTITKIINKEKVNEAIHNATVKLNVGAGHICFDDYINIDEREINNIDIVADVRKLPFEQGVVTEIYASHLIEHFSKKELENLVLPHWVGLLKKGGKIRVILPDLESMIAHYIKEEYDINFMVEVLYGLQEYPGDIHYAMYGRQELKGIFEKAGLNVEYVFIGRKNGKCYDMELDGIKIE